MNSDSTGSMLAPWMSPGVNSPLLQFTAKTSMQRVYDVHFPRRVKNEKQSGAEPQTVQEPLRILPEAIRWDMPPETSMRWALTQRFSSESSDAIIGPMSSGGMPSQIPVKSNSTFTPGLFPIFCGWRKHPAQKSFQLIGIFCPARSRRPLRNRKPSLISLIIWALVGFLRVGQSWWAAFSPSALNRQQ